MHKKRLRKKLGKRYRSRLISDEIERLGWISSKWEVALSSLLMGTADQDKLDEIVSGVQLSASRIDYLTALTPESAYRLSQGFGARQISAVKSVR